MLPSGIFFTRHQQEAALLRTPPQRAWFAAMMAVLIVAPTVIGASATGVMTTLFITIIAVLGLQITTGMAGQINLGQSAFVGVGAFAAAKLAALGAPIWLVLPFAGVAGGISSILFGLPAARVKGFYLALTTFAAQVIFPVLMIAMPAAWFGGADGLAMDPPSLAGLRLDGPVALYLLALGVLCVMALFAFNLGRSRIGRAFRAVRDNDRVAGVLGIDLMRCKATAFFVGAGFAGVAGALYAWQVRYVTTEQFTLWQSVWYVGMLLVGGLARPLGAILGATFVTLLQELLRSLGASLLAADTGLQGGFVFAATNVLLGAVILAVLIYEPRGLAHRWDIIKAAYRIWPYPHQ